MEKSSSARSCGPIAYALLGSSRQLIVGPEGSLAALIAAAVLAQTSAGSPEAATLAAMLALLVAGLFLEAAFQAVRSRTLSPLPGYFRGLWRGARWKVVRV